MLHFLVAIAEELQNPRFCTRQWMDAEFLDAAYHGGSARGYLSINSRSQPSFVMAQRDKADRIFMQRRRWVNVRFWHVACVGRGRRGIECLGAARLGARPSTVL